MTQYESDLISYRVNNSIAYRRNFGVHIGSVPYGKRIEPVHKKELIDNIEEQKLLILSVMLNKVV